MTLWNPMNVFSSQQRSAGDEPTASFDPSRTGDPLGPSPEKPAIAIGGARVGGAAGPGDPRRHPIGFAPSEERSSVTQYRTEISFKRHHEQPRASATPGPAGPEPVPATPDTGVSETVIPDPVVHLDQPQGAVEGAPSGGEATPFYKREISFRRKRETPEQVVPATAVRRARWSRGRRAGGRPRGAGRGSRGARCSRGRRGSGGDSVLQA